MGFVSTLVGSFHSTALYRAVRSSQKSYLGYALLLVSINALVVTIYVGAMIHTSTFATREGKPAFFDDMVSQIAAQIPVMTVKDHMLITKDPAPTVIKVSGTFRDTSFTDVPLATIDTSGATTFENMQTPLLVTNKHIVIKTDKKTEVKDLSELTRDAPPTLVINRAMAEDVGRQLTDYMHRNLWQIYLFLGGISLAGVLMFMFIMRASMLLVLGLVGLLIASLTSTKLNYQQAFALAAISYTPVALLDMLLFATVSYPVSSSTLLLAGSVALFVAIRVSNGADHRATIG